ncbi:hypothetical protein AK812_SmicGene31561 [Symbiodinium microadriaticum]|uniref:Uncharacterized protein n=1 Tax=Symbiodinium microadriaticum TaxID=2951 RepID=A0A1Q9CWI5_SYMMI|nr:hypothetical protein AK812_SmicGene31561 [Symbiodinium microadriaticum]CAE7840373.1 unnamed protein product [Symbiodinium microadriaticum]CAE7949459.1 unnamed protein product [Symbiodinium sp. KB8]
MRRSAGTGGSNVAEPAEPAMRRLHGKARAAPWGSRLGRSRRAEKTIQMRLAAESQLPGHGEPSSAPKPGLDETEARCEGSFRWLDEVLETNFGRAVAGMVALWVLGWTLMQMNMWRELTPVYRETSCGRQESTLNEFRLGVDEIYVDLQISVHCQNPNAYKIDILDSEPGIVQIVAGGRPQDRIDVGRLKVKPGSSLSRYGKGKVLVDMNATIQKNISERLLPVFLNAQEIPILMQLRFQVGIRLFFGLGGSWQARAPFNKACGLQMMGVLVNSFQQDKDRSRLGPLVCKDTWDELLRPGTIPAATEARAVDRMDFAAAQVAPWEVQTGELAKNVSFSILVVCSCLMASIFMWISRYGKVPEELRSLRVKAMHMALSTLAGSSMQPSVPGTVPSLAKSKSSPQYPSDVGSLSQSVDPAPLVQVPEEDPEERDDAESWTRPSHQRDLGRQRAKTENIIAEMKALGTSGAGPSGDSSSSRGLAFRDSSLERPRSLSKGLMPPDRQNSMASSEVPRGRQSSQSPGKRRSRIRADERKGSDMGSLDGLSRATSRRSGQMGRSSSPRRRGESDLGSDKMKSRSPSALRKSSPAYDTEMDQMEEGTRTPPDP